MPLYQNLSELTFLFETFTLDMNLNFSNVMQAQVVIELC